MRLGEQSLDRYSGFKRRAPLYLGFLLVLIWWLVYSLAVKALVRSAGWWRHYWELILVPRFLGVLLVAAIAGVALALAVAPLARVSRKWVAWGCIAGSVPEAVIPLLALGGFLRQPFGAIRLVTAVVDVLSWPGRGLALACGHSTLRWAVGLSIPLTVEVANEWSLVMVGNVFAYGLAVALVARWLPRRSGLRGEPHNNSLQRTRYARR